MNKTTLDRLNSLAPAEYEDGPRSPRYVRIYDNGGKTVDRYTVVYTRINDRRCHFRGMSENPTHPQGFCQMGEAEDMIDAPSYSHLGKPIKFVDLPFACQVQVLEDYAEFHNLPRQGLLQNLRVLGIKGRIANRKK